MMGLHWLARLSPVLAPFTLVACVSAGQAGGHKPESQPPLPVEALCVRDHDSAVPVQAEQATTWPQQRIGLMGRETMDAKGGMLFVYERARSGDGGFWMRDTLIPLDIAYLGVDGEILAIRHMVPCLDAGVSCPVYAPGVPYWMALEVNAGFFEEHGVGVGGEVLALGGDACEPGTER